MMDLIVDVVFGYLICGGAFFPQTGGGAFFSQVGGGAFFSQTGGGAF